MSAERCPTRRGPKPCAAAARGAVPAAVAVAIAAALTGACGGEQGGPQECRVSVQLSPTDAVAPATITAQATVTDATGVLSYQWRVTFGGDEIATTPRTPDGSDVDFVANDDGVYDVSLTVPGCLGWQGDKNVRDPGAAMHTLRLRFVPPAGDVPGQERVVMVPGGADWAAGVLTIDPGTSTAIVVRDPLGVAVPSYVRLTSRATPDATIELVTGAGGDDRAALATGAYDALLVPLASDLAPALVLDWDPLIDPPSALTVDGGSVLAGLIQDPAGAPLAGARVSMAADDDTAPSTVATTGADGRFTLRWRAPAAAALAVVPPPSSGLPRLTAPLTGLVLSAPLTVRYAAALAPIQLGGTPVRLAGAPAAGGHVTFALERAAAATITDGTAVRAAAGRHRDTVAVDGSGLLATYRASASAGRVYVGAAPGDVNPGAVILLDLAAGAPASLDGAQPVVLTGAVVDPDGLPIPDARLRATLGGDLAHLGAATPTAVAGTAGQVSLVVAPGATYDLEVVDPRLGYAATRRLITAAGALGDVALARAITITGEVRVTGQSTGLPSVGVSALCYVCTGLDRSRPLGDGVTDVRGAFAVAIPDPGTAP